MNRAIFALLGAVLAATSSGAAAGDYSDAVAKQSKCESAGKVSQSFHGTTRAELRSAATELMRKMKVKELSEKVGGDTKYLILLGHSAKSPKDAYMAGWSWCMDQK